MKGTRSAFLGFTLLALAACGGGNESAPATTDMSGFTVLANVPAEEMIVPEGVSYTSVTVGGATVAQISDVPDGALPSGSTGGVGIRLPAQFETDASGSRVQITIRASSPVDGALLGSAYSTAEVGNSNWQRFTLSTEPRDYVFGYDVLPMQAGNGDYLGFRSYGSSPVLIWGYKAEIVPPAP